MGLLLANPVKRSGIVIEKAVAMVLAALVVAFATFTGTALGALIGGLGMDYGNIAATCLQAALLGTVFGAAALAFGAGTGQTKIAIFGSIAFALVSYFTSSFLPLSEGLQGFAKWSPYYYFLGSDPLVTGMDWAHAGVLAGLTLVLIAASVFLFQRRDLAYSG